MASPKQPATIRTFPTERDAERYADMKTRANRMAGWIWVIADHPEGFAVLDIKTAISSGIPYDWRA